MEDREHEINLRDYLLVLSRRKFIVILSVAAVMVSSVIFTPKKPLVYSASSILKVEEPPTESGYLFIGLAFSMPTTLMDAQIKFIGSQDLANEVVQLLRSDMAKFSKERGEMVGWLDTRTAVREVLGSISARQMPNSNLLEINVVENEPKKAMDIANTAAKVAVVKSHEILLKDINKAIKFAEERAKLFKQRLLNSQEELAGYKKSRGFSEAVPGSSAGNIKNMENQYVDLKVKRQIAEENLKTLRNELAKQHNELVPSIVQTQTPLIQKLREELVNLEVKRSMLLRQYTEKHPDVVELQMQIDSTKNILKEETTKAVGSEGITRDPWDMYQKQVSRILELEVEIDTNKIREASFLKILEEYSSNIREQVEKDTELRRLVSDVATNESAYNTLMSNRDRLLMAASILKANVEVARFASLPGEPVKQKTGGRIIISMLLGLVLGLTAAFIEEHMDTSMKSIDDIKQYLNQPVVGVIPLIMTKQEKEKRDESKDTRHQH